MTDNKYHKGKIYTIRSYQTDKYYIGSTCDALHKRLYGHRQNYKNYLNGKSNFITSCDIIKYEDNYIELLEDYKCESKNELHKKEGELIRKYKNEIVNYVIAGRTDKEYREDNKDKYVHNYKKYYEDNKDKIKELKKEYREDNKDKIEEKRKKHYEDNKEKIKQDRKKYYDNNNNKDKIIERITKLYDCECGKTQLQWGSKSLHNKTKFHLNHI
tara:strand:+ start:134 stop:775 length:642 start_codon:yes stop_codon:yes gene_type:complete